MRYLVHGLVQLTKVSFRSRDNLISVLVAVGSPALAGYSLAVTKLNSRRFAHQLCHHYSNKENIY
jgi:riboflavin synthase alpha subunit